MLKTLLAAFALISTWEVIIAMFAASIYGLVIGSLPGLSATLATALLVPVTFYLSPIAAIATIVAASSMAIFSGDNHLRAPTQVVYPTCRRQRMKFRDSIGEAGRRLHATVFAGRAAVREQLLIEGCGWHG